ncbi:hypothetical protein ACFQI7_07640 [Paenibacillus allorhizosphaerae]|uniref:Uncharacterized protein n=1 Tax=Paenibacillus allorhizosphaerae TaxID=2849866 RepID=A0ABN7TJC4_9BACL|nr:hypothetical protein [Paenibacillus allorhizosphaerae]CAG7637328.1 hypothetical protein PAECIP111802_02346 [Paenibacillus allorhizosphaerae]
MLAAKLVTNAQTGRTIHSVGSEQSHTVHGYFTASSWRSNSRDLIVSANVNPDTYRCRYVLYNTETGGSKVLAENVPYEAGTSASDDHYYYCVGNKILAVDYNSAHVREICTVDEEMKLVGPVSISNDCMTVSVIGSREEHTLVLSIDVPTGEWRVAIDPLFAKPFPIASHAMVNPVYPVSSSTRMKERPSTYRTGSGLSMRRQARRTIFSSRSGWMTARSANA